jgi:hypothetical protein
MNILILLLIRFFALPHGDRDLRDIRVVLDGELSVHKAQVVR